ncbi:MAG: cell division ATP-binding protein FtsE [Parvibaculales bacterium]
MIELNHASLRYDNGAEILRDINLHLAQGSFHFLTGPSGAGKTSLLKLIFLAHPPSTGTVQVLGKDIATLSRRQTALLRRQIGVVFQDFRLLAHLSVFDNVTLPLRVAGGRIAHYRQNAIELLNWVGLGEQIYSLPETLSGGEKQRAAIARAVIARPKIIIADEPTGNVDIDMGIRIMHLLDALNRLGTTCLVATHDPHIWEQFSHPRLHLDNHALSYIDNNAVPQHKGTP